MLSIFRKNRGFFDDFFDDLSVFNRQSTSNIMKTDITETDAGYALAVELPGYTKDDVKVSLEDGYLLIEAHKSNEKETNDDTTKYIRKERYFGSMKRSYYVGNLDIGDIKGSFKDGILHLDIPKETKKESEKRYLDLK